LFSGGGAEAISIPTTSGTISSYGNAYLNIAGPDFTYTAQGLVMDRIYLSDCLLCMPGQGFNPSFVFAYPLAGVLTWQGVPYGGREPVSGYLFAGGLALPTTLGPAFTVNLPVFFSLSLDQLNFGTGGSGVMPVTFTPTYYLGNPFWVRTGTTSYLGTSVPEPHVGWLLLAGLPMLVGVGCLVRRSRKAGTRMTAHN